MKSLNFKKINLELHWKIIISIFAIGWSIISIFAWQIYLSKHIGGGYFNIDIPQDELIVRTINKDRLQKDLLILENQQLNFSKIKTNQSKVIDPSL